MIKVFHCADIHLDSPFSLCSPREAERHRTELRAAFTSAIMFACENKADIFLISGDLFDREYVTRDTKEMLIREFMKANDMRFFISPGNHDALTSDSPYYDMRFPENVYVFGKDRERVSLKDLGVDVYGFGFESINHISSPVANWKIEDKNKINILVCHGDTTSSSQTGPIKENEIASSGFDYIALGHIHKPSGILKAGETYYAYPGCIEGRGFDEQGYKGALFGNIDKGVCEMQSYRFSKGRYETAEVDVSACKDKISIVETVRAAIRIYTDDTSLRLILKGEADFAFTLLPEEIGKGREYPCYIEIIDETFLKPDLTELEKSNTLRGVFVRLMTEKLESAKDDPEKYKMLTLALKYGLASLEGRSVVDYNGGEK